MRDKSSDTGSNSQAGTSKTAAEPVPHLTLEDRIALGRAARAEVPRRSHAVFVPAADRRDPVDLLEKQAAERVAELVPIRYGRMLVSPFTFYRGAAAVMAADLAGAPRTGLTSQLCGDAHLSNFGAYAAPDRRLVFDINDFDETLPGPFEWDLKRLVASFAVAGRNRGFDPATREVIHRKVVRSYRESMASCASRSTFDIWYARVDVHDVAKQWRLRASGAEWKRFEKNVAKAGSKDSLTAFAKLTHVVDGEPQFVDNPPLIVRAAELFTDSSEVLETVRVAIRAYRATLEDDRRQLLERFRFVDLARKVVGVGSVGTRAWMALFVGRDNDDPLILQIKEALTSVLEPSLGKSRFANHGRRVVEGQRLLQAASDTMLGWIRAEGEDGVKRDFYVRQLWDSKGSALIDTMKPPEMIMYARVCGEAIALAHARSGDPVAIASYLGKSDTFDRALAAFAEAYADQNERDYEALKAAAESGRITVRRGV